MKVIGVGLNKTGTTSLGLCFEHWGLSHIACSREAFELWRKREYIALLKWIEEYESFEDWPWPLIYKEIDKAFPGTKFILTRRKDAETWFRSLCKHAKRTGPTDYRKYIYGYDMPHRQKKHHIRFYEAHLNSVRAYFKDQPDDFLEVCWEEGDGWDQLAAFLGFESTDIPFPHAKKSPTFSQRAKALTKRFAGQLIW